MLFMMLIVWVFIVGLGWMNLSQYENTAGQSQSSPDHWPSTSKITRTAGLPVLLMFVHPQCPCTRASMRELSLIMTHCQNRVKTQVVFMRPEGFSQEQVKTDLWRSAVQIPGVEVLVDEHSKEARIFHVNVSGQTMLYDTQGKLVFSGGITSSRGHEGDSDGKEAIISFLTKGIILKKQTPFFGCLLFSNQEKSQWK